MSEYAVALYTFGSFHGFASDPGSLGDAKAFVAAPPDVWKPRPQDSLVILELVPFEEDQ